MADMEIRPPSGSRKKKRISGRGPAGRRGGTAGKGDKGQNARSGGGVRPGFEGGQMPLYRRIPRKGFSNYPFKKTYDVVNVGTLDRVYEDGETVTVETLKAKRIVKKKFASVKILGTGELTKKLTVDMEKVSARAKTKIESAGGSVVGQLPESTDDTAKADAPQKAVKAENAEPKAEQAAEDKSEEKGSVDGE